MKNDKEEEPSIAGLVIKKESLFRAMLNDPDIVLEGDSFFDSQPCQSDPVSDIRRYREESVHWLVFTVSAASAAAAFDSEALIASRSTMDVYLLSSEYVMPSSD